MADSLTQPTTSPARLDFAVEGMTCASCATRVQRILSGQPGVESVDLNYATSGARVVLAERSADADALRAVIEQIGYRLTPLQAGTPVDAGGEEAAAERAWLHRVIVGWPLALASPDSWASSGYWPSRNQQPWWHSRRR
jgi:copper-transporting P-type ATPase V